MAEIEVPYGRKTQRTPAVEEVDILWITAGLSCDGDSVSITAATQPSIEDIVLGAIRGLPKVRLHNPVLAFETGSDFLAPFHLASEGKLGRPFVLVVEGSIPNEKLSGDGFWAAMGMDENGVPIRTCDWIDRLASKAWAVVAIGTCATYGGMHAMSGNPTGAMGLPDYLGWEFKSAAGLPIVCVPGCPVQPDKLHGDAPLPALPGGRPLSDDRSRRGAPSAVALRADRSRGLRSRRLLRAGRFCLRVRRENAS